MQLFVLSTMQKYGSEKIRLFIYVRNCFVTNCLDLPYIICLASGFSDNSDWLGYISVMF